MNNIIEKIPEIIKKHIKNSMYNLDDIGCSDSQILCFENDMVLKKELSSYESNIEFTMMKWLQGKLPVPKVIEFCTSNGYNYLLMSKMDGLMSCGENYLNKPEELVRLLAEGLKILWKTDIYGCPNVNDTENKLKLARTRIDNNLIDVEDCEPETFSENGFKDVEALYKFLVDNKPNQELVFSHGDYCMPNIFFINQCLSGFIDLGRSGVADKWQDIALCVRSIEHNLGNKNYIDLLFKELGIERNDEKIRYYILLDELF
jgi:kanamycin kinase/aminoglycoside 3'-phosphotransferase-3